MRISDWSSDVCSSDLTIVFDQLVGLTLGQDALSDKLVGIHFTRARMLADAFVHQGLRQRWGILFVVAQLAEADNIDHDVVMELHAVVERQLRNIHHGRSGEHTSELQSLMRISYAVFCLKKKKRKHTNEITYHHTQ